jgi:hypothetical protein
VGYELLGKPSNKNGYKIDPTELTFMHAASKTYSTASWIKRVRTWGKALKGSEMAANWAPFPRRSAILLPSTTFATEVLLYMFR